jgi:riboflavin kinase/FMN adenylyltransferase
MRVARSIESVAGRTGETAVALGFFDGVHLGHRLLISDLVNASRASGLVATCLTLDPHPCAILGEGRDEPKLLTSLDEKLGMLESLGIELCVVAPFTREFSLLTPREFASSVLKDALGARIVAVGYNYTFGRGATGTSEELVRLGSALGFEVRVRSPVIVDGEPVSSSAIRGALAAGEARRAARMLGRPYSLSGVVAKGDGRGRSLGIPTANIRIPQGRLLPADGVYAGTAAIEGGRYPAVTNVGLRPTYPSARRTARRRSSGPWRHTSWTSAAISMAARSRSPSCSG